MNKQYKIYFHIMGCVRYGVVAGALRVFLPDADVASAGRIVLRYVVRKVLLVNCCLHGRRSTAASASHMKTKKIQRIMFETEKKT